MTYYRFLQPYKYSTFVFTRLPFDTSAEVNQNQTSYSPLLMLYSAWMDGSAVCVLTLLPDSPQ